MNILRRLLLKTGLTSIIGFSVSESLLKTANAQTSETPFSTLETNLDYNVTHGRIHPIYIDERGDSHLPAYAPTETSVEWGNVIIKWNMFGQNTVEQAHWIRLSIYKPRPSVTDTSILYTPPVGLPDTVRFPAGDNTTPTKEHSEIWQNWISPNWQPVDGPSIDLGPDIYQNEFNNSNWPGQRHSIRWVNPSYPDGILVHVNGEPLRVSVEGVIREGGFYLLLLEIKRRGRLRLLWRPVFIKPIIGGDTRCYIATATYGSHLSPEVEALRVWRDEALMTNRMGRLLVNIYYSISPFLANLVNKSNTMKTFSRWILTPIIKRLAKRY